MSESCHTEHAWRGSTFMGRRFPADGPDEGIWETCGDDGAWRCKCHNMPPMPDHYPFRWLDLQWQRKEREDAS